MQTTELRLVRGDTDTYTLTFKSSTGTAIAGYNITNWLVFFTLKKNWNVPDSDADLQKIVTSHSDPTNGITQITITHADTHLLDPGEYYFDIQAVTGSEAEVITVLKGKFYLDFDVTKTVSTAGTAGTA